MMKVYKAIRGNMRSHSFTIGGVLLLAAAQVVLASSHPAATTGEMVAADRPPTATPAEMREAGLLVGNTTPFGPTDGILRYDGLGAFIDKMIPVPDSISGLQIPCCLTFGPDENLYVSSPLSSSGVLRFNGVTGAFMDTFIPGGSGGLGLPLILLFHEGYLYVGDTGAGAIRRYDAKTGAYVDNFIPDNSEGMGTPFDLQHFAFGPDQDRPFPGGAGAVRPRRDHGATGDHLEGQDQGLPSAGREHSEGPYKDLYVAAEISKRVLRYDGQTGAFIEDLVPSDAGFSPSGLTFGPDELLYVGSAASGEVRRYDVRTGTYEVFIPAGGRLSTPVGIAFGPDGNFYAAAVGTSEILRYDGRTGRFLGALVPSGRGGITAPRVITWKAKTKVCHQPGGNTAKGRTLTIGYLSALDHLRHGDTLGSCE